MVFSVRSDRIPSLAAGRAIARAPPQSWACWPEPGSAIFRCCSASTWNPPCAEIAADSNPMPDEAPATTTNDLPSASIGMSKGAFCVPSPSSVPHLLFGERVRRSCRRGRSRQCARADSGCHRRSALGCVDTGRVRAHHRGSVVGPSLCQCHSASRARPERDSREPPRDDGMAETPNRQLGKQQAVDAPSPSPAEMKAAIRETRVRLATRLARTADHVHILFTAPSSAQAEVRDRGFIGGPSIRSLESAESSVLGATPGGPVSFEDERSALRLWRLPSHSPLRQGVADKDGTRPTGGPNGVECL